MQTRLPKTKCVWPMKISVICTVSVLPSLVTPVVDVEVIENGTVADYAPPAAPPVESVVNSPSRGVREDSGGSWIPEFVPDSYFIIYNPLDVLNCECF